MENDHELSILNYEVKMNLSDYTLLVLSTSDDKKSFYMHG